MLTLYVKSTCPFCQKVCAFIDEMNLDVVLKEVSENETFREELIAHGGKKQVPYLVDTDKDVAMYESDDIIDFLELNYSTVGEKATDGPRVHGGANVCIACEG